jgi:hypothetical protein
LNVSSSCVADFRSTAAGQLGAIVGTAMLQPDGSFSGADLQLGTVNRTGCTGTWDAPTSTLVVDCGGVGTSQSCIVTSQGPMSPLKMIWTVAPGAGLGGLALRVPPSAFSPPVTNTRVLAMVPP